MPTFATLRNKVGAFFLQVRTWWISLSLASKIATFLIGVVILGGLGYTLFGGSAPTEVTIDKTRKVEIKTVAELSSEQAPLSLLGTVTSRNEATLLAETSGRITGVYRSLGDAVSGGSVIAELENSAQRAAVTQATGSYQSAQAAYEKASKSSVLSLSTAKEGAVNALISAYAAMDDAVSKKTDVNFTNPKSQNPTFVITSAATHSVQEAQNGRVAMSAILAKNTSVAASLTLNSELESELVRTEENLRFLISYLDTVLDALSSALADTGTTASTIASNKADATLARTTITATLSTVVSARQTLKTQLSLQNNPVGGTAQLSDDAAAAYGSLKAAEGALAAAQANLEKTLVRAPFGGTINMLDADLGNYVSLGTPVATIANNGNLEIVASITETDRAAVAVGNKGTVNGATVTITKIAPALDPQTKKIEVRFSVPGGSASLTNGASVRIVIPRKTTTTTTQTTIPITALKITPEGSVVFTLAEDEKTLAANEVTVGPLLGDKVVILTGLTPDTRIVTDARGLKEGETVFVQ